MNQRIRELLAQAISDVDYIYHGPGAEQLNEDLSQMSFSDVFADRFAQLIVAECAQVSEDDITDGDACCTNTADRIARQIKKHFGVE